MSEYAPETPAEAPQAEQQPTETAPEAPQSNNVDDLPQWARDALTKANKEAASYRTKVKELEPKAKMADALEEASKTEQQRLQEAAENAQRGLAAAQAEALRYRLAAKYGVPEEDFDLLGVGSEEELEDRAKRLAAKNAAVAPPATRRPQEQLRPGATPGEPKSEDDVLYSSLFGSPSS